MHNRYFLQEVLAACFSQVVNGLLSPGVGASFTRAGSAISDASAEAWGSLAVWAQYLCTAAVLANSARALVFRGRSPHPSPSGYYGRLGVVQGSLVTVQTASAEVALMVAGCMAHGFHWGRSSCRPRRRGCRRGYLPPADLWQSRHTFVLTDGGLPWS